MAKFVFIAFNIDNDVLIDMFTFFYDLKVLNVVVLSMDVSGAFEAFSYNPFFGQVYQLDDLSHENVFPDKLRDMNKKALIIMYYSDPPRLIKARNFLAGVDIKLLQTFAHLKNGKLMFRNMGVKEKFFLSEFLANGSADFCINTGIYYDQEIYKFTKKVQTYDVDGFCALVPFPQKVINVFLMFDPFDIQTWILIAVSKFCCMIVWYLLNKRSTLNSNSASYFLFANTANFLGQSVPFRKHRTMQKIILQTMVFMSLIIGSVYQSLIIASITNTDDINELKTIDELINSNYSFYASKMFVLQLNGSDYFQRISPRIISEATRSIKSFEQLSIQNIAVIETCTFTQSYLNRFRNDHNNSAHMFFYQLQESFNTFYLKFASAERSLFVRQMNDLSLRLLESGLKQRWVSTIPHEDYKGLRKRQYYENEEYLLKIDRLSPTFYQLIIGFAISSLIFLMEIFAKQTKEKLIARFVNARSRT